MHGGNAHNSRSRDHRWLGCHDSLLAYAIAPRLLGSVLFFSILRNTDCTCDPTTDDGYGICEIRDCSLTETLDTCPCHCEMLATATTITSTSASSTESIYTETISSLTTSTITTTSTCEDDFCKGDFGDVDCSQSSTREVCPCTCATLTTTSTQDICTTEPEYCQFLDCADNQSLATCPCSCVTTLTETSTTSSTRSSTISSTGTLTNTSSTTTCEPPSCIYRDCSLANVSDTCPCTCYISATTSRTSTTTSCEPDYCNAVTNCAAYSHICPCKCAPSETPTSPTITHGPSNTSTSTTSITTQSNTATSRSATSFTSSMTTFTIVRVLVSFRLDLDYDALVGDANLEQTFKDTVKTAVANEAGVSENFVEIEISRGSVVVQASIKPSRDAGVEQCEVHTQLQRSVSDGSLHLAVQAAVAGLGIRAGNSSGATTTEQPVASEAQVQSDACPAPDYNGFRLSGACATNSLNGLYRKLGPTASGSVAWSLRDGSPAAYVFHDPDCNGQGAAARWSVTSLRPNLDRAEDLDSDGTCAYFGRLYTESKRLPEGTRTWWMYCDPDGWQEVSLTIEYVNLEERLILGLYDWDEIQDQNSAVVPSFLDDAILWLVSLEVWLQWVVVCSVGIIVFFFVVCCCFGGCFACCCCCPCCGKKEKQKTRSQWTKADEEAMDSAVIPPEEKTIGERVWRPCRLRELPQA